MNNKISYRRVVEYLDRAEIPYVTLDLDCNFKIVVCEYGGRIFGPFCADDGESMLWMSDAWCDFDRFKKFVGRLDWNIGGDRFWIQPELPFFTTEKDKFFDTYVVQAGIDPGTYTLKESDGAVTLEQKVVIEAYELPIKKRSFGMRRCVKGIRNPFSEIAEKCGIHTYTGYTQTIEVEDFDIDSPTYLEGWLLSQINPCGELIVPFTGKGPDALDYYEPIPKDMVRAENNKMFIKVTGDVRYKLGFKSLNTTGRSAYIGSFTDGMSYLFVRNFYNDPSSVYCGAPYFAPEVYGYPLFLYNDPGSQGGFAEFENCGRTIGGDTGIYKSEDKVDYYFFVGDREKLLKLAYEII